MIIINLIKNQMDGGIRGKPKEKESNQIKGSPQIPSHAPPSPLLPSPPPPARRHRNSTGPNQFGHSQRNNIETFLPLGPHFLNESHGTGWGEGGGGSWFLCCHQLCFHPTTFLNPPLLCFSTLSPPSISFFFFFYYHYIYLIFF